MKLSGSGLATGSRKVLVKMAHRIWEPALLLVLYFSLALALDIGPQGWFEGDRAWASWILALWLIFRGVVWVRRDDKQFPVGRSYVDPRFASNMARSRAWVWHCLTMACAIVLGGVTAQWWSSAVGATVGLVLLEVGLQGFLRQAHS